MSASPDPSSAPSSPVLGRDAGNPPQQQQQGLRLLAFDGGGIRGLSSLLILQGIMEQIRRDRNLDQTPRPHEFFDLIGGTSTGGLIAILLGRLRMSVDQAIEVYLSLSKKVFTTSIGRFLTPNTFDHKKLEACIKEVVQDQTGDADAPMRDPLEDRCCRTFVLSLQKHAAAGGLTFLRTYAAPQADPAPCTIWQAGRATTAAASFFPSISVPISAGGVHADLVDAGMGFNNPSHQVLDEARMIWGGERQVGCLVSIGTGRLTVVGFSGATRPSVLLRAAEACVAIATDCETTHESVLRLVGTSKLFLPSGAPSYLRFNVDQGMQGVGTGEWEKESEVVAHTQSYMNKREVAERKLRCAERLVALASPQIDLSLRPLPPLPPFPPTVPVLSTSTTDSSGGTPPSPVFPSPVFQHFNYPISVTSIEDGGTQNIYHAEPASPREPPPTLADVSLLIRNLTTVGAVAGHDPRINAAIHLLRLAQTNDGREHIIMAITNAKVVPQLVQLLSHTGILRQHTLEILTFVLGSHQACAVALNAGIAPLLVRFLSDPSHGTQVSAACALANVTRSDEGKKRAVEAGAMPPLVGALGLPAAKLKKMAVRAIMNMASIATGRKAAYEGGAVQPLVVLLDTSPLDVQYDVVRALAGIAAYGNNARKQIKGAGAYPKLKNFSQSGTPMPLLDAAEALRDKL